jgi:hypothetical protein
MATNLQVDDDLILKAVRLGGHKTKKAAVSKALVEYIHQLKQEKILTMFGTVEYELPDFNSPPPIGAAPLRFINFSQKKLFSHHIQNGLNIEH